MDYEFSQLDPITFQRLINAILVARFGENVRLMPLRGSDGGRDAESDPLNRCFEVTITVSNKQRKSVRQVRNGHYLFQVKHHNLIDASLKEARRRVIADFKDELMKNVLPRSGEDKVDYFYLITNVPASKDALAKLHEQRRSVSSLKLSADVWWRERIVAFLDALPSIWPAYPDLFPAGSVPFLGKIVDPHSTQLPHAMRMALHTQFQRDSDVKFRQIELDSSLSRLFVDLDFDIENLDAEAKHALRVNEMRAARYSDAGRLSSSRSRIANYEYSIHSERDLVSAINTLLVEDKAADCIANKMLVEGGPGQGKSTLVQAVTQIYRQQLLRQMDPRPKMPRSELASDGRWTEPQKCRFPIRIELRFFADWLLKQADLADASLEQYIAYVIKRDSGGAEITVSDIHAMVENSPILLVLDGLDEVASDDNRTEVLGRIGDCITRFETTLNTDLRVIITTRPPAIAGHQDALKDFARFKVAPLTRGRIDDYVNRWIGAELRHPDDIDEVRDSFDHRREEPHVRALTTNPMQLSILLNFIHIFRGGFPDRKAELYRDYFQVVIKRDIDKSAEFRSQQDKIERLHEYLGFQIHALTEVEQADGTLSRPVLIDLVKRWLADREDDPLEANRLFNLGEERLGLIFALRGQGDETNYGFEVQPIREYFAAAFINHQISGNAHEVFEAMIRRPYWREVALFLAGLSKPNEKEDLVARARHLDNDPTTGWRNDGRAVTLELLQEGVYSEPPYVFSDALTFTLESLDKDEVPAQRTPPGQLEILSELVERAHKGDERIYVRLIQKLRDILSRRLLEEDQHGLYRVCYVLCHNLPPEDARNVLMQYQGSNEQLIARMRDNVALPHGILIWSLVPGLLSTGRVRRLRCGHESGYRQA